MLVIFPSYAERRTRSDEKVGGSSPARVSQVGSTHRTRQHRLLKIGRLQHRPRAQTTQLGDELLRGVGREVRTKKY